MTEPHTLEHDWFPEPLPGNVSLGERSWLHSSYAFVHFRSEAEDAVVIGDDTGIYKGSYFDLGPGGRVRIGNFCTVVGAIFASDGLVVIDDYCFIAHEVVIADSPSATPAPGKAPQGPVVSLGRNAWVGAQAVLLAGASIGEGSIVGAGAVVDGVIPPYSIAAGNPARVVGKAR